MNDNSRRSSPRNSAAYLGGLLLISIGMTLPSCTGHTAAPAAQTPGESRPSGWSRGQLDALQATYRDVVVAFIPDIGSDDLAVRTRAQRAFESICMQSAVPGRDGHRWAMCSAIVEHLDEKTPQPARLWLVRKLEQIGGGESVAAVSGLLTDTDIQIRDAARRALSINPSSSATSALEAAGKAVVDARDLEFLFGDAHADRPVPAPTALGVFCIKIVIA